MRNLLYLIDRYIQDDYQNSIIDSLNNLPENLTIDQVIDHLVVVEKIQKGLEDSASGRVYEKEQAKEKLKKWLK